MKKKVLLWIFIIIFLFIIVGGIIIFINANNNTKEKNTKNDFVIGDKTYEMYISINPIIKINFKEKYKKCENKKLNNKCEISTIITEYELVNDDAKNMLKDIELKEKDILDVIPTIVDNINDNNINFKTINITTDWKDGYEETDIKNKITEKSKYNKEYNLVVDKVETINANEIRNSQIVSKKIEKNAFPMLALNTDGLKEKELNPTLAVSNQKLIIEVFGKKEIIDELNLNDIELYVDFNDFNDINLDTDITGQHEANIYVKTNKDIYYTITPNKTKISLSYYPKRDMNSITNEEIKAILNKYELSTVHLTLHEKPAVTCRKNYNKIQCHIYSDYQVDDKPTKELFEIYNRFNITYDSKGFPLNINSSWCKPVMGLFNCLDQTWFDI